MKEKVSFCKKTDSKNYGAYGGQLLKDRLACTCHDYCLMVDCAFYKQVASPVMISKTARYTTMCRWLVVWSSKGKIEFECTSREAHLNMKVEEL